MHSASVLRRVLGLTPVVAFVLLVGRGAAQSLDEPARSPTSAATMAAAAPASGPDGREPLTFAALFESDPGPKFDPEGPAFERWLDAEHFLEREGDELRRVHAESDQKQPAIDRKQLDAALGRTGLDAKTASAARIRKWSQDRSLALVKVGDGWFAWRPGEDRVRSVLSPEEAKGCELIEFSPAGGYVSFVRGNDLFVRPIGGWTRRLTRNGSPTLLNGKLDWVYQEEVFGRHNFSAAWWREDDRRLAFLQVDQSQVPAFEYVDNTGERPVVTRMRYPRPGDPNPRVRLAVADPDGLWPTWVDLSAYDGVEILVVGVSWAPDGRLVFMVQDRRQIWLDLVATDENGRGVRRLLRELSPAWTDNGPPPRWLPDGSFLWLSARDGYQHIYHCAADGALIRRVTSGAWEVSRIEGIDAQQRIYFTGTRDGELESHVYRTPLAGGAIERLTEPGASHTGHFNPDCTLFLDRASSVETASRVTLRDADGAALRTLGVGDVPALRRFRWRPPEFATIPTRDGDTLNALLTRPAEAWTGRRPVLLRVYGGPGSQTVRNRWGGKGHMENEMLAQELGLAVVAVDPRSGSGRGKRSSWRAYRRLGVGELADLEDAVAWLETQPWADARRVAIAGHSYGGYMACYALTHSDKFALGLAGAPVTDWRLYDSIYTERYMGLPSDNPEGYAASSVIEAADKLHGRLVLGHGLLDDNVHFQNTVRLIEALQKHRKQFEVMPYPLDDHGIGNGARHWERVQFEALRGL